MWLVVLVIALAEAAHIGYSTRNGRDLRDLKNKVEMPWLYDEHNGLYSLIRQLERNKAKTAEFRSKNAATKPNPKKIIKVTKKK